MKWTGLNELREKYLSFFESKGHLRMASFPLVPLTDKGLLLINAGMAPLKNYFAGIETPPAPRATTCQKCVRTNDIEQVGKTSRHCTYFEMLGNFSFGDYFKRDAAKWAWEYITQVLEMPVSKLWVTIYLDDDEAFDIWTREVGVATDRVIRLGKEDNFWEIGAGPCGPCSEIYYDRGEQYGCGSPDCAPGCDCDRFVEFWNLVFTQFNSDGNGGYTPLATKNIDTGMGLERIACIMQGVENVSEVDTFQNIMGHVCKIASVKYKADVKSDFSLRVITDHIRSSVFLIGDGVVPSNEGRGYILRRLIRRAARHGRLIGIEEPFLYLVCDTVIGENETAYPELTQKRDYIKKVIRIEEERFAKTIGQGVELLNAALDNAEKSGGKILSGEDAFKLYDTFGFPIDLTREITEERGFAIDDGKFEELMALQREHSRSARAAMGDFGWTEDVISGAAEKTEFVGYNATRASGRIAAIAKDGELSGNVSAGEGAIIVTDVTPFYAESGGQVGDTGVIKLGGNVFAVEDTKKAAGGQFIHIGKMTEGILSVGDGVSLEVDNERRRRIMRNHSACHLLQEALREVLGDHVHQAGSMVSDKLCRFDFSHFSALTKEEIAKVEHIVNTEILNGLDVSVTEMNIEDARSKGATALFGEKYGNVVRVCDMSGFSIELCGGIHVGNTSNIGLFKIISESSVAANVRRIEAVTGEGVLALLDSENATLSALCECLHVNGPAELVSKAASVTSAVKARDRQIETLNTRMADIQIGALYANAPETNGFKVIGVELQDTPAGLLKSDCEHAAGKYPDAVVFLCSLHEGKVSIAVACGKGAVAKGANAGKIVKAIAAKTGGSGGGRPDVAMGGAGIGFKFEEIEAGLGEIVKGTMA